MIDNEEIKFIFSQALQGNLRIALQFQLMMALQSRNHTFS